MSKTAWFFSAIMVIVFCITTGFITVSYYFLYQEPAMGIVTINKMEFSVGDSGNFTMNDVRIEIPNRSLDWLPLAGITLRQNSY